MGDQLLVKSHRENERSDDTKESNGGLSNAGLRLVKCPLETPYVKMSQENLDWGRLSTKVSKLCSIPLKQSSYTFGRGAENGHIDLSSLSARMASAISKSHFQISRELGAAHRIDPLPVYIEDLSTHGTFVNGQLLGFKMRRILAPNDVISIVKAEHTIYKFTDYLWKPNDLNLPAQITTKYFTSIVAIGSGTFGKVLKAFEFQTCKTFAIKKLRPTLRGHALSVQNYSDDDEGATAKEVKIMKMIRHPCIVELFYKVIDPSGDCLVMELVEGGTLRARIEANGFIEEPQAKFFAYQLSSAVAYLHTKNITHRDIKTDNILLVSRAEPFTRLKLIDFGLSKVGELRSISGTTVYMAPEIFEHEDISKDDRPAYNKKVDVWSTGVLMYCMFSNGYPFDNEDDIQWKRLYFKPRSKWEIVTVAARTLIRKMLDKEPATRLSIAEVLADAWFTSDEALMQMAQRVLMDVEHQAEMQQNEPIVEQVEEEGAVGGVWTPHVAAPTPAENKENRIQKPKRCFVCNNEFSGTASVLLHMENAHGIRVAKLEDVVDDDEEEAAPKRKLPRV